MGTRCNTIVKEGNEVILNMYRQYDGYLSGYGKELKDTFGNTKIINGFGMKTKSPEYANGLGCLAAQIVCHFKNGIGGIYLENENSRGNDYCYEIYIKEDINNFLFKEELPIYVKVFSWNKEIYDGLLSEMPTED